MKYLVWFSTIFQCFLTIQNSSAQDTIYIDVHSKKVNENDNYDKYEVFRLNDKNKLIGTVYSKNDRLIRIIEYNNRTDLKYDGKLIEFDTLGNVKKEVDYVLNKKSGYLKTYFSNGKLKRSEKYLLDSMIKSNCYTKSGLDTSYYPYEVMPMFPGGEKEFVRFIRKNVIYPKLARNKGYAGTVYIDFIIDEKGKPSNVRVKEGKYKVLNDEALRIISIMPIWIPGRSDGDPVPVQYTFPVSFKIN